MNQELLGIIDQINVFLQQRRESELRVFLASIHPADLAEVLEELEDEDRTVVLRCLSDEVAADTIAEMEPEDQAAILESVGQERAGDILEEMSADDVADLVGELTPSQGSQLLDLMDADDATDVRELLEYRTDTAGGIMTTEFVAIHAHLTCQGAIDRLRSMAPEVEMTYYTYVTNEREQLVGVLSLRELIISPPGTPVRDVMRKQVVSVNVNDDQEAAAQAIKKYNLLALPVVDDDNVLLGIVTVDDAMDVLEEEATEDIYRAAGVHHDEAEADLAESSIWSSVRSRLPWLLGLLFLSLVSGGVIEHFNGLITTVGTLSVFITTMAGGSGNAATQSLTVVVRGMATGEIDRAQIWKVVRRELKVGFIIGLISGVTMAGTAMLWQGEPWVGLIVGLALVINLTLAKGAGALVPLALQGLGLDPTAASGPFIATVTDTTSMVVYFSIASAIVAYVQ